MITCISKTLPIRKGFCSTIDKLNKICYIILFLRDSYWDLHVKRKASQFHRNLTMTKGTSMKFDGTFFILASNGNALPDLVEGALKESYGFDSCLLYELDAEDEEHSAKLIMPISLIILITDWIEPEEAKAIYERWSSRYPNQPIVWFSEDDAAPFYGNNWPRVTWCSSERFPKERYDDNKVFKQFGGPTPVRQDGKSAFGMLKHAIESALS